jgi:hypothetical protein
MEWSWIFQGACLAFFNGEEGMNQEKAGCVDGNLKNGKKNGCAHQRMVDEHCNEHGTKTGHLVCRECGAVIHESVKT